MGTEKLNLVESARADVILVIDFSNIANRVYYATKDHRYLRSNFANKIGEYLYRIKPMGKISLVWALDEEPTRKLTVYPEYKKNRKERDIDPKELMLANLDIFESETISCVGEEADDVVASFAYKYPNKKVILVSNDKDMDQLILVPNFWVVDPKTDKRRTKEDCVETFGVEPSCVALFKTVFGDAGDNVKPAVKGLRKDPILPFITKAQGDLHEFLRIVTTDTTFPEKAGVSLMANVDRMFLNWKLVKLNSEIDFATQKVLSAAQEAA